MTTLSTESVIQSGAGIFHYSYSLDKLVASGNFDSEYSNHQGAFYFTPERTLRTNCVASLTDSIKVFDYTTLPHDELELLNDLGKGDFWNGAVKLGFDGRLFYTQDPFAKVAQNEYCAELLIFSSSVHKIADIRALIS